MPFIHRKAGPFEVSLFLLWGCPILSPPTPRQGSATSGRHAVPYTHATPCRQSLYLILPSQLASPHLKSPCTSSMQGLNALATTRDLAADLTPSPIHSMLSLVPLSGQGFAHSSPPSWHYLRPRYDYLRRLRLRLNGKRLEFGREALRGDASSTSTVLVTSAMQDYHCGLAAGETWVFTLRRCHQWDRRSIANSQLLD